MNFLSVLALIAGLSVILWGIIVIAAPTSNHFEISRCYVPMGNKYSTFTEKDYKLSIHENGVLFIYRKSDNHLMLATSSFTGVCDDSIDPNVTAKPEKE